MVQLAYILRVKSINISNKTHFQTIQYKGKVNHYLIIPLAKSVLLGIFLLITEDNKIEKYRQPPESCNMLLFSALIICIIALGIAFMQFMIEYWQK